MSLLAPLYVLGALAVSLPVIFHLIRRQTKQRMPLSTVMFLPPSQPRLTRRSRLENLPLLLLRALALILLALAFSRPFLRSTATETLQAVNRRVVVLVDTSASMRRGDLWDQALAQLRDVTENLRPGDSLAVASFDAEPNLRIGFDAAGQLPLASVRSLGEKLFAGEQPSWRATDLAAALRMGVDLAAADGPESAAGDTQEDEEAGQPGRVETQLVLISDMQSGAALDSLQGFSWPKQLPVDIRRVLPSRRSNAWITLPGEQQSPAEAGEESGEATSQTARDFRLRVSNAADSRDAQFRLAWLTSPEATAPVTQVSVQIAPGQSRIVRVQAPPAEAIAIALSGDDHDFDNIRYVANAPPREQTLLFVGEDAEEPRDSLLYYLQRLSLDTPTREVTVRRHVPADGPLPLPDAEQVGLVVASGAIDSNAASDLRRYVRDGGRLLYVLPPADGNRVGQSSLRLLSGDDAIAVREAVVEDYAMLSRIDFSHPLFVPLADPKFNDFSKIRYWAHRTVDPVPEGWKRLASFDDGSPALLERIEGEGRFWVFTAGWQPIESQLALSTKFIPLMFGMFDAARGNAATDRPLRVGDPFPLTPNADSTDGSTVSIVRLAESSAESDEVIAATRIERPGVFRIVDGERSATFAVNLAESESRTDPMGDDELERLGVMLGKSVPEQIAAQTQRQLRDVELESQQRLWQWLLIGVLGLLGLETWLSGWLGRRREKLAAS